MIQGFEQWLRDTIAKGENLSPYVIAEAAHDAGYTKGFDGGVEYERTRHIHRKPKPTDDDGRILEGFAGIG